LAEIATVCVRQADVDDEHIRVDVREPFKELGGLNDSLGVEACLAEPSKDQ
jgi:hypothetical protein